MRYISDDGKVFNTEQECLEHQNTEKKRLEDKRIEKEKYERVKKERWEEINKHNEELMNEIASYEKDYGVRICDGFYKTELEKMIHQIMCQYI